MTLVHTATCAFHQLPICTCGALSRWIANKPASFPPRPITTGERNNGGDAKVKAGAGVT